MATPDPSVGLHLGSAIAGVLYTGLVVTWVFERRFGADPGLATYLERSRD